MQRPLYKHITTFLFLVAFLLPRVANVHAWEHLSDDDETIACELCDITTQSQEVDLFLEVVTYDDTSSLNTPNTFIVNTYYNSPLDKIATPTSVYNKPPPQAILG